MPRRRSVLLMMLWSVVGVPVLVAQDFYEQQFQNGRGSLASGKALEASTQLRIAAFGPQLVPVGRNGSIVGHAQCLTLQ